jgi:flagellin-specific chaperone FliS
LGDISFILIPTINRFSDILVNTLEVLHEIRRNGLKPSLDKLEPVRSDFHAHLEKNPSSEISTKLGEIYSFYNEYMCKLEAYAILQSSLHEECDKAELLGDDRKIEKLEDIRNQLSKTLRGESDMNLWAKKDRLYKIEVLHMLRVYAYIHLKKSISRLILLKSLSLDFFPNVHENLI